MIIVDSNVFAKLFTKEPDSAEAVALLKHLAQADIPVRVPTLFVYELAQVARYFAVPLKEAFALLDAQLAHHWKLVDPHLSHWQKAEEISQHGHKKSGYPALYDAIYHALALLEGGIFLTADQRYQAKAAGFGQIALLQDWRAILH